MCSSRVLWEEATGEDLEGNIQLMKNDEGWKSHKFQITNRKDMH